MQPLKKINDWLIDWLIDYRTESRSRKIRPSNSKNVSDGCAGKHTRTTKERNSDRQRGHVTYRVRHVTCSSTQSCPPIAYQLHAACRTCGATSGRHIVGVYTLRPRFCCWYRNRLMMMLIMMMEWNAPTPSLSRASYLRPSAQTVITRSWIRVMIALSIWCPNSEKCFLFMLFLLSK